MTSLELQLVGVMHFVNKWFDDDDPRLLEDPVARACYAREIALKWGESLEAKLIRFARREDAEAMRNILVRCGMFTLADPRDVSKYKVTEHMFYSPKPALTRGQMDSFAFLKSEPDIYKDPVTNEPTPKTVDVEKVWHVANEWADAATNSIAILSNYHSGVISFEEAIAQLQHGIDHAREVAAQARVDAEPATPKTDVDDARWECVAELADAVLALCGTGHATTRLYVEAIAAQLRERK